jgi:hypothetical protein
MRTAFLSAGKKFSAEQELFVKPLNPNGLLLHFVDWRLFFQ